MNPKNKLYIIFSMVALALIVLLLSCGEEKSMGSDDFVVHFPDPNLESAVRGVLGIDTGEIYFSELQEIEELYADSRGITDISGISNCEKLEVLSLDHNLFSSINRLRGMPKLRDLSCSHNSISDLNAIASLISLRY